MAQKASVTSCLQSNQPSARPGRNKPENPKGNQGNHYTKARLKAFLATTEVIQQRISKLHQNRFPKSKIKSCRHIGADQAQCDSASLATVLPAVCTVISITRKNCDTKDIIEGDESVEGDAPAIGIGTLNRHEKDRSA